MAKAFRDLKVWQLAMDLTAEVYRLTELFPKTEQYGITAQVRRCAVSIPSNIAEGSGRATKRDFANFVSIARGSNYELETQILIAVRLGFCSEKSASRTLGLSAEVGKLLKGLNAFLQLAPSVATPTAPKQKPRNLET